MSKPLSPAAQAVLDAAMASAIRNLHGTYECDIAAALYAAAHHLPNDRRQLAAIADELDGHHG
jgi:hypothetical protein